MREIKFRGIVKDSDLMVYGDLETCAHKRFIDGVIRRDRVEPETVGQFTGLKDIEQFDKPKKLYTGDIVKMHQFLFDGEEWENEITGVLEYDEEVAAVCITKINHYDIRKYMGYSNPEEFKGERIPICMFYGLHETSWTYVGNIYENPELLEDN